MFRTVAGIRLLQQAQRASEGCVASPIHGPPGDTTPGTCVRHRLGRLFQWRLLGLPAKAECLRLWKHNRPASGYGGAHPRPERFEAAAIVPPASLLDASRAPVS